MAHRQPHLQESADAGENARRVLPALVSKYFAKVRKQLSRDPSPPELHAIRLATKRLRYTLELFRPCYGPGFETRMAELREVQKLLGDVNDASAARKLLSEAMNSGAQKKRMETYLDDRAEKKAADFRREWTEVFDAPGRERWWTAYLAREARSHNV